MCKRLTVIILILGVLFVPSLAFADDGFEGSGGGDFSDQVIYGPNVLDIQSGTYGVQVYAGNRFNAALCVLGFDGSDSRFTNDVKAYLSNESTGGSFYEFSNLFTNNNSPNFAGFDAYNITFQSAIGTSNTLYGAEFVWIARYTDTLRQAAYARVDEVLAGDVGSGGGTSGNTYTMPIWCGKTSNQQNGWNGNKVYEINGVQYWTFTNDNRYQIAEPVSITVNDDIQSYIESFLQSGGTTYILGASVKTGSTYNMEVVHFDSAFTVTPISYTVYKHGVGDNVFGKLTFSCNERTEYQSVGFTATFESNTNHLVVDGNQSITLRRYYINANSSGYYTPAYFALDISSDGNGGGAPVVPPTQWPEPDPVTPTEPPEVPSPTPTDPPTEPTITVPTVPTLPPLTYPTEPTYQTADLAAVLDAMAKHCVHLQECMKNVSDDYYDSMTAYMLSLQNKDFEFLRSWFRVTLDTIRDCFDDLSDYLQRLFTWLADQFDFTFTGGEYDDSSILWWLKQIYSKLGSGTTVRPTDPVVDPTGIGDWFDQLIKNFIAALLGLGSNVLSDVGDMVEDLTTKFPFSIPWDIAALLALFAATPQVPVFEIPQYALTGSGVSQVGMYTIDLTPYDGVMDIARSIEKVVFAFWLAWKIDFFKAVLNGIVGGDK